MDFLYKTRRPMERLLAGACTGMTMIIIIIIIIFNQQDIIRDTFDTTHNNKLQNI